MQNLNFVSKLSFSFLFPTGKKPNDSNGDTQWMVAIVLVVSALLIGFTIVAVAVHLRKRSSINRQTENRLTNKQTNAHKKENAMTWNNRAYVNDEIEVGDNIPHWNYNIL